MSSLFWQRQWLKAIQNLTWLNTGCRVRRARFALIERLEDRALLTANLPVAVNDSYVATENTIFNGPSVLVNDTDADGDPVTKAVLNQNASHGNVVLQTDGTFAYTPQTGYVGPDSFSYFAVDPVHNEQSAAAATVTINVGTTNSTLTANPMTISTSISTAATGFVTGTGNAPLTFSPGTSPPLNGTAVVNTDGSFTFTPTPGFTGTGSFSFVVSDGTTTSNEAIVTVNITASGNVAPVGTAATINVVGNTTFNGTLTATDANGDILTFVPGTTAASHGTVTINSNGQFSYTPTANYVGDDSFSFTASDGTLTSQSTLVTVHVGASTGNSLPVVSPVSISTTTGFPVTGTLTGTDANSDPLTFSAGSIAATHGTVVINPSGAFTFTPTAGYSGTATFSYKANDGKGNSNIAIVTVTVSPVTNNPPTATNGTGTTIAGTKFNGSLSPLGDDPNHNQLTFAAVTQPEHGTLSLSPDGTFTYDPDEGFSGTDSFLFKGNDSAYDSNLGEFTFTVTPSSVSDLMTLNLAATATIATTAKSVVPLDSNANLTNIDPSVNFANASIQASITQGADSKHDKLIVTKDSNSPVQVRGKKILINGEQVATISGGKQGHKLMIKFTESATADTVNAVLARIAAQTSKRASDGVRTVKITVQSGIASTNEAISASKA
jgi:VCBS repeat-containing protein